MAPDATWFGWAMKGRDCGGTYDQYRLSDLPVVVPFKQLEHIKTPADIPDRVKQIIEAVSYTACFFKARHPEKGDFFHDQQDCVVWCFEPETGHVVAQSKIVAFSLPEFLSRVLIESHGEKNFALKKFESLNLSDDEQAFLEDIARVARDYKAQLKQHPCTSCVPRTARNTFWAAFTSNLHPD